MIVGIEDMNPLIRVADNRPRIEKLSLTSTLSSPGTQRFSVERQLLHPVVSEFANINVPLAIEDQVVRVS